MQVSGQVAVLVVDLSVLVGLQCWEGQLMQVSVKVADVQPCTEAVLFIWGDGQWDQACMVAEVLEEER